MVYSDEYKFIFLAVPKTGSRTLQSYLKDYGIKTPEGWSPNHDNYQQVKEVLGEERFRDYFKFAFFRNPWSLLISIFFFNRYKHGLPLNKKTVIEWLNSYRGSDSYAPYMFDEEGNVALDFMGRLERIEEDFKTVCQKINIPVPKNLPVKGKENVGGRLHYTAYYEDMHIKEKIRAVFTQSNSVLKYEFGG